MKLLRQYNSNIRITVVNHLHELPKSQIAAFVLTTVPKSDPKMLFSSTSLLQC